MLFMDQPMTTYIGMSTLTAGGLDQAHAGAVTFLQNLPGWLRISQRIDASLMLPILKFEHFAAAIGVRGGGAKEFTIFLRKPC